MIEIKNNYGDVITSAEWIPFNKVKPKDGQLILCWPISHFYNKNDGEDAEPFHKQMQKIPYLEKFSKEEFNREGDKPNCSMGDIDLYQYSEYWLPVPELPDEAKEFMKPYDEEE